MNEMIEYMRIHLVSLRQDIEKDIEIESDYHYIAGQIEATRHLLSVAEDILNK